MIFFLPFIILSEITPITLHSKIVQLDLNPNPNPRSFFNSLSQEPQIILDWGNMNINAKYQFFNFFGLTFQDKLMENKYIFLNSSDAKYFSFSKLEHTSHKLILTPFTCVKSGHFWNITQTKNENPFKTKPYSLYFIASDLFIIYIIFRTYLYRYSSLDYWLHYFWYSSLFLQKFNP